MKKDSKGIGGFMETMVAMMVVTIAISAFMTAFAYTNLPEQDVPDISIDFLNGLSLKDGSIIGLDENYAEEESKRKGYDSMTICIRIVGKVHHSELLLGHPTPDSDQIIRNGTFMMPDDGGQRHAAAYEVIAFV